MQSRQAWIAACVVVFVLWLAVVVTGSRSGVAMILIAFVTCLLITVRRLRLPGRRMAIVSIGALSLLAVPGAALHGHVPVNRNSGGWGTGVAGRCDLGGLRNYK